MLQSCAACLCVCVFPMAWALPTTMKAGALTRLSWDLKLHLEDVHEVEVPVPKPSHGQVLIRVAGSSVNPVDYKLTESPLKYFWHYPHVLGRDCVGTVVALGGGNSRFRVGDRVWGMKALGESCFAEYAVMDEADTGLAPPSMSLKEAGVLPLVSITGLDALTYAQAPWKDGNRTVVVLGGSGGTGHVGIQLAKAFGAKRVIATCGPSHITFCSQMGADQVIDYHKEDWHKVIPARSVDVVYDTVALKSTGDLAYEVLKDGGYFVTLLHQGLASWTTALGRPSVHQHFFTAWSSSHDKLDMLMEVANQGKLHGHVDSTFTIAQVAEAFNASLTGHTTGKISVVPAAMSSTDLQEPLLVV